jgi:glycosyltransferase involved in cell wall biosynthesis
MKVLFTTPVLEHPAAGGPQLRITNSIKALNTISELHVISRVSMEALGGAYAENYFKSICHRFTYSSPSVPISAPITLLDRIARYRVESRSTFSILVNLPFKVFYKIYEFIKRDSNNNLDKDVKFIKNYVVNNNIDIIWFGYGNISFDLMKALKECLPKTKMVCDTDSVWSRYVLRELDVEMDPERRKAIKEKGLVKEAEEKSWVAFMDVTTAVSEVDAEYYRSIASDINKIKVFSNVIDTAMYKNTLPPPDGLIKPCMYLAGTFGHYHSPMNWAARWIIEEILPLVKKKIPDIHFYMVGRGGEIIWGELNNPSVTVTGKLLSVLPYLCNADVALVPLKFESGTRFKILEAGACGIPIVSTTLGAEGIPVTHNKDILIADTPIEFAEAIIRIIQDKKFAAEMAINCKKLIENKYSVQHLAEEGKAILEYIKENNTKSDTNLIKN